LVTLGAQNDLSLRWQGNLRNFGRIDDPKIGLLFPQPVKEERCAGFAGDLARVQCRGLGRGFP